MALAENSAKLTPRPVQVAPSGNGSPSRRRAFRITCGSRDLNASVHLSPSSQHGTEQTSDLSVPPAFQRGGGESATVGIRTTPIESQSNGMAEAFVRTIKRDYVRVSPRPDAPTAVSTHGQIGWVEEGRISGSS